MFFKWGDFTSQGPFGNARRQFGLSQLGEGDTGIWWVEAQGAAQHPIVYRTAALKSPRVPVSEVLRLREPAPEAFQALGSGEWAFAAPTRERVIVATVETGCLNRA